MKAITVAFLSTLLTLTSASPHLLVNTNYHLAVSAYNPVISQISAKLSTASVGDVLDAAQFKPLDAADFMKSTPWYIKGFQWSENNPQDDTDEIWTPTGISTSADQGAYQGVVDNNSDILLVSWNDQRNLTGGASVAGQGVRVSFVRKGSADGVPSSRAYIHTLLVEPYKDSNGNPNFRELTNVISGGLVWRGDWLYITDQDLGLRVFDLTKIWKVSLGSSVGLDGNSYYGGDFPFVIPQARTYTPIVPSSVTFNPYTASLDRNSTPPCILLGESTTAGTNPIFARFPFNDTSNLLATDSKNQSQITAEWAYLAAISNAKGITFAQNSLWIVKNNGDDVPGDVLRWNPGSWGDPYDGMLPGGVEGVSYKPAGDELWMVGSAPGKRYVMALSASMQNGTGTDTGNNTSDGTGSTTDPSASGSSTGASGNGNSRLSGGAKAGIAVGVLAGVGGILAGVLVLLKRRKVAAAQPPAVGYAEPAAETGWYAKPELSNEPTQHQAELPYSPQEPVELPLTPVTDRKELHA